MVVNVRRGRASAGRSLSALHEVPPDGFLSPTVVDPVALDRAAPRQVLEACRWALMRAAPTQSSHIGVTSALAREGRSTVALGLALVQHRDFGRKTLLVELDFERPSLAARLGISPSPGIAELLRDEAPLDECLRTLDDDLTLLPAGDSTDEPARLIADLLSGEDLRQLQMWCEAMVADLPPVLSPNATAQMATLFSSLMFVVRAGATPAPRVEEAISDLPVAPTLILNSVESRLPRWIRRLSAG